jgi:preprotein translocase subunit SecB
MMTRITYPFDLTNTFFICLDFQRGSEVPPNLNIGVMAEMKVVDEHYPDHFQVNLKISSQNDTPIKFSLEMVGIFSYTGNQPDQDKNKFIDFLNDQGFLMIWPFLTQMVRFLTSQMGMQVLNLKFPPGLFLPLDLLENKNSPE